LPPRLRLLLRLGLEDRLLLLRLEPLRMLLLDERLRLGLLKELRLLERLLLLLNPLLERLEPPERL
jgi:hypothetical protein